MTTDLLAFFSKDNFSCLDFDDVTLLDEAQRQAVLENMDHIVAYCLAAIGYKHIAPPKDIAFRTDLWDRAYSRLSEDVPDPAVLDAFLEAGASLVETYYPSACHQARMCVAFATAVALIVDDVFAKPHRCEQLEAFSQRYMRGLPQPEGVCAAMAESIRDCDEFYGSKYPRVGTTAAMGWLNFIDGCCVEAGIEQELPCHFVSGCSRDRPTEWSVENLAWHIRIVAGVPTPYIVPIFKATHDEEVPPDFWISGIPDLKQFILLGNDLLSFSKEMRVLEQFNYLSLLTRARRQAGRASLFDTNDGLWTFRDSIYEACDQLISCTIALDRLFLTFAESLSEKFKAAQARADLNGHTEEIGKNLKSEQKNLENARLAAKYWGEFRQGYFAWHINTPRYQLDSLRATFSKTTDDHTTGVGEIAAAVDVAAQEPILAMA
ncbi:hypothetical protein MMC07_005824 [Pseudocyphellaria aurata]|nr:hypothetical protein [Pseudocyphellaria aurata]